jgi:predicted ATPase
MTARKAKGTWFTGVRLANWRNFTVVDVELRQRAFLVGPNASGKSNLLDVFRFLHDIVAVGGGLQEAVRKRGGISRLRSLAARQKPDIGIQVCIGNAENPNAWQYELHFAQDSQRCSLVQRETVWKDGAELLSRPNEQDESDPERLTQTYLEQVNVNKAFREVADFFQSVRYLHIVPQLIREPDRSVGRVNDPFGGNFLEQIAATSEKTRKSRLKRILSALQVAVPQIRELEMWRDNRGVPHLRGKYEHWRPQGAWQNEDDFSDGTLRLLGLLWSLLEKGGPLLLEEPELSLHPAVVQHVPSMFARVGRTSGRQVLVSTHSADLLRDEGIGLDEVLLLSPDQEGTVVRLANSFDDIRHLVEGGLSLADAIIHRTHPAQADQLGLFGVQ